MTTKSSDIDRQYLQVCRDIGEAQYTKELIVTFLKVWREHANGVHGIAIPETTFTVEFMTPAAYGVLSVVIIETPFELHPTTVYKLNTNVGQDSSLRRPWTTSHKITKPVKTPSLVIQQIVGQYNLIHIPLSLLYSSCVWDIVKAIANDANDIRPTPTQLQNQLAAVRLQLEAIEASIPKMKWY